MNAPSLIHLDKRVSRAAELGRGVDLTAADLDLLVSLGCFIERERQRSLVTGNAQMLLGGLTHLLMQESADAPHGLTYAPREVDTQAGTMIVQSASENMFRISVVQIGGAE